jgi:hypothetical protein
MNLLSFLDEPRFNPLREYFKNERHELHPTDFLPAGAPRGGLSRFVRSYEP